MLLKKLAPITGSLLVLASQAPAQFNFDPATSHSAPSQPENVAVGDFNGDGNPDMAVATDAPDKVSVLLGNGDGSFGAPVNTLVGAGSSPTFSIAADFDGDKDVDVAVTLQNSNAVRLLLNSGGTLVASGTFNTGLEPRHMAAGDLDGDLDLDLVTSNRDDDTLTVLLNVGGGVFTNGGTLAAGQDPRSVVLADLDGDTDLDVAVSSHDTREVRTFTNTGGVLSPGPTLSVGPAVRPDGLVAADFDGDTDVDLAASTGVSVTVFTNMGGGSFSGPAAFNTNGTNSSDLVAADLNVDGDLDLAVANTDSNDVSLLAGAGNATFGAPQKLTAGTEPDGIAAADFDGNGGSDLATGNNGSNDVSVFLNQEGGPIAYCTAKPSSAGCITAITTSSTGLPVSGAGDYSVDAMMVQGQKNGLVFGSNMGAAALPFSGGLLCVQPPLRRGPIGFSGGTSGLSCDGTLSTIVNDGTLFPAGLDGGPGGSGWYQFWYRDPANGAGNLGTALSNAVQLMFL